MNLRGCAAQVLSRVIRDHHSLTGVLENQLSKLKDPKDRAFVQALCYGVIRHYFALDFILNQLLDKPLKPKDADIYALLLIGVYQLQYMRVKPHAAVSETVAATRHKPWSKSLVNAILRHYLRDAEELQACCQNDLQAALNHPRWIIQEIESNWPEQAAQLLAENNQPAPMALRVNVAKGSRADYLERLQQLDIYAQISNDCPTALILDSAMPVDQLPGFSEGLVSVQDVAAQLASGLLDVRPGHRVLDLCAAPGGKTAAILEQCPNLKSMLATDIEPIRLQRIQENLARLNLTAETQTADASNPSWANGQTFDRILLDAPCSGFGVIRRHPDIKLLRRESDLEALRILQASILSAAWGLLAPGGILLYATCSILKQENEAQIATFLSQHPDAVELPIDALWGMPRPHGRQILTGDAHMDGFYYAKLGKRS